MSAATDPAARLAELDRLAMLIEAERNRLRQLLGRKRRSRDVIPPCGTHQAYQRHIYRGEPTDDACKEAWAAHCWAQEQERKGRAA